MAKSTSLAKIGLAAFCAMFVFLGFLWAVGWGRIHIFASALGIDSKGLPITRVTESQKGGEPLANTNIAGVDYRVPIKYLSYGVAPEHETGILIHAALPDMSAFDYQQELKMEHWRKLIIMATDAKSTTSFQFRLGVTRERYGVLSDSGGKYGLHYYKASRGFNGQSLDGYDSSVPRDQLQADFFVDDFSGNATTFIECTGDKEVPAPECDLNFSTKGLLYNITFDKSQLAEWKAIQSKATALIEQFSMSAPINSIKGQSE